MKKILFIIALISFQLSINAQHLVNEIRCLDETIIKDGYVIKRTKNIGTIYTIDELEKTIIIQTIQRNNSTQDDFIIEESINSHFAKVYTCSRVNDNGNSKYFITVMEDKVTLLLDNQGILIENPIISIESYTIDRKIKKGNK